MDKIISNERVMDAIYEAVAPNQSCDNLIETEELAEKYRDFVDSYAYAECDMNEQEVFIDDLNDVIFSFVRSGFNVGLKTGISLITGADVPVGVE